MEVPVLAGAVSTVIFAVRRCRWSSRPRAQDLASYSLGNIVLANVGNVIHSIYIVHLPFGPISWLHGFHVVTTAMMLFWYVRHALLRRMPGVRISTHAADHPNVVMLPTR